jgi:exopolysaccharide biosynthesis polyprenyl glycosylphosphotransferase
MRTLFGHSIRSELVLLYVSEALACFVAIYLLSAREAGSAISFAIIVTLCAGLISGASGLYQPEAWSRGRRLLLGTLVAGLLLLLLAWPVLRLLDPAYPQRLGNHLVEVLLAFVAAVMTTRLGLALVTQMGLLKRRLLLVAPPRAAGHALADGKPGPFEVIEVLLPDADLATALAPETLRQRHIWGVVASDPSQLPDGVASRIAAANIRFFNEVEFREQHLNRVDIDRLPDNWIATTRAIHEGWAEALLRRVIDLGLGLLLVLVTLPLLLLTALAIRLDSKGPIFYRQTRVGRDGRVFELFKFRSMVVDAEQGGATWAKKRDPRITRVGRIIRLTRIDEIPQVLNVLRGDMAFVGPRPERPEFVAQLAKEIPHYNDRALVRPGITGWAQVNYPYGASVEDARMKLAYDLYYIARRSLFLDLLILVATVRVVLFQEGSR